MFFFFAEATDIVFTSGYCIHQQIRKDNHSALSALSALSYAKGNNCDSYQSVPSSELVETNEIIIVMGVRKSPAKSGVVWRHPLVLFLSHVFFQPCLLLH